MCVLCLFYLFSYQFVLISLDKFKENRHNKGIRNELDAWLAFLSQDKPGEIIELLEAYPHFQVMYQDIYDFCRNLEEVMQMFSKELRELDELKKLLQKATK